MQKILPQPEYESGTFSFRDRRLTNLTTKVYVHDSNTYCSNQYKKRIERTNVYELNNNNLN